MTDAARVWDALRSVSDPEYPMSIVDLGIVYDVRTGEDGVTVDLTFTSIGCPAMEMILEDVERAVRSATEGADVTVNVVWSPPWTKQRISPRGRRVLALYGVVA